MARGYAVSIVEGHVGADPEVRTTADGKCVVSLSIAVNEVWKDKEGKKAERVNWHRVKLFGRIAEIARDYVSKGSLILVQGSPRTDKYVDKDGIERYSHEIVADVLRLNDRKPESGSQGSSHDDIPEDDIPF